MDARAADIMQRYAEILGRHVIPIYYDDEQGRPYLHGSGLLVGADNASFLVTAGHVLDEIRKGTDLYIYAAPKVKRRLVEHFVTNSPIWANRENDKIDIAVLRFNNSVFPSLSVVDKTLLPFDAMRKGAMPREGKQYVVLGFPGSKSVVSRARKTVDARPYAHICKSVPAEKYRVYGLSEATHIVLEFKRKRAFSLKGVRQIFPDPGGMSGSPVWMMFDADGTNDPLMTPVVGILTTHPRNSHVFLATDIGYVTDEISRLLNDE